MRNKKYRPWKLLILILAIGVLFFAVSPLVTEKWEKVFMIVGGAVITVCDILLLPIYFEVKPDRIVARGTTSLNKAYNKSFKKLVFMFDEIDDIWVEQKKILWIQLKEGCNVSIAIHGQFHRNEIIGLVYEVRAQIKGYEQNK